MRSIIKRGLCIVAALCLFCTGALAELGWVDDQLSSVLDINNDTVFSLGIQVNQLQPFGDDTVAMINEVLAHLQVDSRILTDGTQLALRVDGEPVLTFEEGQRDGRAGLTTSLLPNRLLMSDASPMDLLSGNETVQEPLFDLHQAIAEAEESYHELTDAIVPFATEKKANYKISGIGYAGWVRLARLSAEDSVYLLPQIIKVLGYGMDQAFREQLQTLTCADNFTIALYSDEENGTPLAVYMKGSVYLAEDEKWTLAYQWAFSREEGQLEDTYRYELEQSKSPRYKRVIEAERLTAETEDQLTITRECKLTIKDETRNDTVTNKDKLTAAVSSGRTAVTGSLVATVKDQSSGEAVTTVTTITPELTLTSAQGSGVLSGTVSLEEHQGKTVYRDLLFTFAPEPAQALDEAAADGTLFAVADVDPTNPAVAGSSLAQNVDVIWVDEELQDYVVGNPPIGLAGYTAPSSLQTVDLDLATPDQLAALQGEMVQNGAGVLLIALAKLPGETLRLLSDNMTDVDYASFLSLLGDL